MADISHEVITNLRLAIVGCDVQDHAGVMMSEPSEVSVSDLAQLAGNCRVSVHRLFATSSA